MAPVSRTKALSVAGTFAVAMAVAVPAGALGQETFSADGGSESAAPSATIEPAGDGQAARGPVLQEPAKMFLRTKGDSSHSVHVARIVKAFVRIKPFVPGQQVTIRYSKRGKLLKRQTKTFRRLGNRDVGIAKMESKRVIRPGDYRIAAVHEATPEQAGDKVRSPKFHPTYPDLDPGQRNKDVNLFNTLLRRKGYYSSHGSGYSGPTERAVMAFRKVNKMSRSYNATPGIFRALADGKGGFRLARPGAGRHVEVDISRQVMVLADRGKAQHIFHVSTGAPSTPSDRGTYRFYRRQPGYNSIGMYYSVYYNRGEAIHGYKSVPPYNASHGCIRNPIPNSRFIYNWVRLGMQISVYN
jgi:L,D-transpeptidase catalytic domain